ncbi:hypothetical protein Tco_1178071, partial [Tanacetum coccineum]
MYFRVTVDKSVVDLNVMLEKSATYEIKANIKSQARNAVTT